MQFKLILVILSFFFLLPFNVFAATSIDEVNQAICDRFDADTLKLAAIMEEYKRRKGIEDEPTVVAFTARKNQVEEADYWINYANEAIAYQRYQEYSPNGKAQLKSNLGVLKNKVLRAKNEVKKVLDAEK